MGLPKVECTVYTGRDRGPQKWKQESPREAEWGGEGRMEGHFQQVLKIPKAVSYFSQFSAKGKVCVCVVCVIFPSSQALLNIYNAELVVSSIKFQRSSLSPLSVTSHWWFVEQKISLLRRKERAEELEWNPFSCCLPFVSCESGLTSCGSSVRLFLCSEVGWLP